MVQRKFRLKRAKDYAITDFKQIIKALKFQRNAREQYERNPNGFSAMLNMALLLQTIEHNYDRAGVIYAKCMNKAPTNPVFLFGYAIWTLASCVYPRHKSWKQANQMIER